MFITGAAISQSMTAESIAVWESYVRESKVEETLVINVSAVRIDWRGEMRALTRSSCAKSLR